VSSDVSAAGRGLVVAAKDGPVQAMVERVAVVAVEIDKSAYFGEGEWDQASAPGGWLVGFGLILGEVPLFLALAAVTARKVWANIANVMCRCQAGHVRTW
jgi:hypothetical protein